MNHIQFLTHPDTIEVLWPYHTVVHNKDEAQEAYAFFCHNCPKFGSGCSKDHKQYCDTIRHCMLSDADWYFDEPHTCYLVIGEDNTQIPAWTDFTKCYHYILTGERPLCYPDHITGAIRQIRKVNPDAKITLELKDTFIEPVFFAVLPLLDSLAVVLTDRKYKASFDTMDALLSEKPYVGQLDLQLYYSDKASVNTNDLLSDWEPTLIDKEPKPMTTDAIARFAWPE